MFKVVDCTKITVDDLPVFKPPSYSKYYRRYYVDKTSDVVSILCFFPEFSTADVSLYETDNRALQGSDAGQ